MERQQIGRRGHDHEIVVGHCPLPLTATTLGVGLSAWWRWAFRGVPLPCGALGDRGGWGRDGGVATVRSAECSLGAGSASGCMDCWESDIRQDSSFGNACGGGACFSWLLCAVHARLVFHSVDCVGFRAGPLHGATEVRGLGGSGARHLHPLGLGGCDGRAGRLGRSTTGPLGRSAGYSKRAPAVHSQLRRAVLSVSMYSLPGEKDGLCVAGHRALRHHETPQ